MANRIPSMDGSGFITDPSLKIDYLMACYCSTQHSQTVLYRPLISSFSKDIQLSSQQWESLPGYVEASLSRLFTSYFDQTEIAVSIDENSMEDGTSLFKLIIEGIVRQDGTSYQLSKELYVNHAKLSSVTDFNIGNTNYA
jgi:hypothetical protein